MYHLNFIYYASFMACLSLSTPLLSMEVPDSSLTHGIPALAQDKAQTLEEEVKTLQNAIASAHEKVAYRQLARLYIQFSQWKYDDERWESMATQLNAYRWHGASQSLQEVVGGHLFYPPQVNDLLASPYTKDMLQRSDIIWSFAIAAKCKHPVAQYHLASILDDLYNTCHDETPKFLTQLYKTALHALEKNLTNPDALYIVASCHGFGSIKVPVNRYDALKAFQYHKQGTDLKNQFEALHIRVNCTRAFENLPKFPLPQDIPGEYAALGDKGYGPAYIKAAEHTEDIQKKLFYFEQALQQGFPVASIHKGFLYQKQGELEQAKICFLTAGEEGIPEGYLEASHLLMGVDLSFSLGYQDKDITTVSQQDIATATTYLEKACASHYPEAFAQLGRLYEALYNSTEKDDNRYLDKLLLTVEKGMRVGCVWSHRKARSMVVFEQYEMLVERYGHPPHKSLYKLIRDFIDKQY